VEATTTKEMSCRRMRARSPRVPPRFFRTVGLLPHTLSTIRGVRAFAPSINREKQARIRGISCRVPSSLSRKKA
jgi:hypothetical protein